MGNRETALIVVDAQVDFMPGGALPVPEGDQIVPVVNSLLGRFNLDVFTLDRHPPGHVSFASRWGKDVLEKVTTKEGQEQVLWPDHCVVGTEGQKLHCNLDYTEGLMVVIHKGEDLKFDSYSAFKDDGGRPTRLSSVLSNRWINDLVICGLAIDYCVKATVLDARHVIMPVRVVLDACRGVTPETTEAAIKEMEAAGAVMVRSADL